MKMADALETAQVDEEVDEGVEVGDGVTVANMGTFDAEGDGLAIDAFDRGALSVDILVSLAVAVEGVAQASADAGGHGRRTALLAPLFVLDGTGLAVGLRIEQGTKVLRAFVLNQADGAVNIVTLSSALDILTQFVYTT